MKPSDGSRYSSREAGRSAKSALSQSSAGSARISASSSVLHVATSSVLIGAQARRIAASNLRNEMSVICGPFPVSKEELEITSLGDVAVGAPVAIYHCV